ncbi:membrane-targeted effector domain-containing toxin [Herbaspirillum autotrophicum]|uniref:membrane-targeted effector domain-containing toxin n=1 Tax=Herbaspirillum autotrophicum TaxID=180195 RepID=UPI000AC3489E|nr:membrane-targeted effector domain-containing toxin [Herbaspirillum autotrophicum]
MTTTQNLNVQPMESSNQPSLTGLASPPGQTAHAGNGGDCQSGHCATRQTTVTLRLRTDSGAQAEGSDIGYRSDGRHGMPQFGGAQSQLVLNRTRRTTDTEPAPESGSDQRQDSAGDDTVSVVRLPWQLPIVTDYSDQRATDFLDNLASSLRDPFGDMAGQIATVTELSPEDKQLAVSIGSMLSGLGQLVAGNGGFCMQFAAGMVQNVSNMLKATPPSADDATDLASGARLGLVAGATHAPLSASGTGEKLPAATTAQGPENEMLPSRPKRARKVSTGYLRSMIRQTPGRNGQPRLSATMLRDDVAPPAAAGNNAVFAIPADPGYAGANVNAGRGLRVIAADELTAYRTPHASAAVLDATVLYQINQEPYAPIAGALYRIQRDGAGQSRLVERGKQVYDARSPYLHKNDDGSFSAMRPQLAGGGKGASRIASEIPGSDSGFSGSGSYTARRASVDSDRMASPLLHPVSPPSFPRQRAPCGRDYPQFGAFEVPPGDRAQLENAVNFKGELHALDYNYAFEEADEAFNANRDNLVRQSNTFYASVQLPARPAMPDLAVVNTPQKLICEVYKQGGGLVVGESHDSMASKKFLIDNMRRFKEQGVATLYMEHLLTDFHQAGLDSYYRSGKMPQELTDYLRVQDRQQITNANSPYTFENMVSVARQHEIRIQAIDGAASYHLKGVDDIPPGGPVRQKVMNYYASKVIAADQTVNGSHKWVALVGNSHANTFQGIPGLAELTGVPGLRVQDVAKEMPTRITADVGLLGRVGIGPESAVVKSDLLLEIGTGWHVPQLG